MSKKFLYLTCILLTIVIGTVLFWYYCCECGVKKRNLETASIVPGEQSAQPITSLPDTSVTVNWQAVRDQLNNNPLTPYFEPYQTEISLSQDDLNKVNEIKNYLLNNPEVNVVVTGYSDITGPRDLNMKLSREWAEFLKSLLTCVSYVFSSRFL